jgi:hypothetical protein
MVKHVSKELERGAAGVMNGRAVRYFGPTPRCAACDTRGVTAMDDLADRLDTATEAMVELGPELAAGEPWPLTDVYAPGPESSWGPREVLAHVSEMLPFWAGEIELILDGGGGSEPPSFGRQETDELRIAIIGRDRAFPARELLGRVEVESRRVSRRLRALSEEDASTTGRHVTRGDLSIRELAERFIVSHLEGHVTQLREVLAGAA